MPALLLLVLWGAFPAPVLLAWFGAARRRHARAPGAARAPMRAAAARADPRAGRRVSRRARWRPALLWVVPAVWFLPGSDPLLQLAVVFVIGGNIIGAAASTRRARRVLRLQRAAVPCVGAAARGAGRPHLLAARADGGGVRRGDGARLPQHPRRHPAHAAHPDREREPARQARAERGRSCATPSRVFPKASRSTMPTTGWWSATTSTRASTAEAGRPASLPGTPYPAIALNAMEAEVLPPEFAGRRDAVARGARGAPAQRRRAGAPLPVARRALAAGPVRAQPRGRHRQHVHRRQRNAARAGGARAGAGRGTAAARRAPRRRAGAAQERGHVPQPGRDLERPDLVVRRRRALDLPQSGGDAAHLRLRAARPARPRVPRDARTGGARSATWRCSAASSRANRCSTTRRATCGATAATSTCRSTRCRCATRAARSSARPARRATSRPRKSPPPRSSRTSRSCASRWMPPSSCTGNGSATPTSCTGAAILRRWSAQASGRSYALVRVPANRPSGGPRPLPRHRQRGLGAGRRLHQRVPGDPPGRPGGLAFVARQDARRRDGPGLPHDRRVAGHHRAQAPGGGGALPRLPRHAHRACPTAGCSTTACARRYSSRSAAIRASR